MKSCLKSVVLYLLSAGLTACALSPATPGQNDGEVCFHDDHVEGAKDLCIDIGPSDEINVHDSVYEVLDSHLEIWLEIQDSSGDSQSTELVTDVLVEVPSVVEVCAECDVQETAECVQQCESKNCGDDGCGGVCGTCFHPCTGEDDVPDLCWEGVCFDPCCADCTNKECGDNGCGALCGACDDQLVCTTDWCENFNCHHQVVPQFCAIDGACFEVGMESPTSPCQFCSAEMNNAWTWRSDNTPCGGDAFCLAGQCCDPTANCSGRECGSDKCGGSCGICGAGQCNEVFGTCIEEGWSVVAPGTYMMGASNDEPCLSSAEIPHHEVTLTRGLLVSIYETTQEQWNQVTGMDNPSYFGPYGDQPLCPSGNCPVERVNWYEALMYCNLLSQQAGISPCYELGGCDGLPGSGCPPETLWCDGDFVCSDVSFMGLNCPGYRLPTEAEWEYFARAGAHKAFAWPLPDGGAKNDSCECGLEASLMSFGWFCHNSGTRTHVVGMKKPNAWELHDTAGNVWEWCWDGLHYYGETAVTDPLANEGDQRAVRGGSFFDFSHHCRSAARDFDERESRYPDIGFRVVRSLPAAITLEIPDDSE